MEFLNSPAGVFAILGLVALAAFLYKPAGYVGNWQTLADWFGTDQRPLDVTFPGENIEVAGLAHFDVTVDDEGLWMQYFGPSPPKAAPCMFIPWRCIRPKRSKREYRYFQLADGRAMPEDALARKKRPKIVEMVTRADLGEAIERRVRQYRTAIDD